MQCALHEISRNSNPEGTYTQYGPIKNGCIIVSVRLWNFKDGGSLKVGFLAIRINMQGKNLYKIPRVMTEIGLDFRK